MYIKNFFLHLHTINKHRFLVMLYCFKCGEIIRGLTHDLSKYSPTEFFISVKYYQGFRSPTVKERMEYGYSKVWLHHKGRNRHHFEYWQDYSMKTNQYEPIEMPTQFLIEMLCDRIAASKVYMKDKYTDSSPLEYFNNKDKDIKMHPITKAKIYYLLKYLSDNGEKKTFKYIKLNRKKDNFLNEALPNQ